MQYLAELGAAVKVVRNDALSLAEVEALQPEKIVISPGPGRPDGAGICLALIERLGGQVPILGICLGHQSIGQAFGGRVVRADTVMHGKLSTIHHAGRGVFRGLDTPFTATRYHSLVIAADQVPDCLEVTAWTVDERGERAEIMGLRHRDWPLEGVQFHPESILSEQGHDLLRNFLAS